MTQGRAIEQAERRAREALAAFHDADDEDALSIDFVVELPSSVQNTIDRVRAGDRIGGEPQSRASAGESWSFGAGCRNDSRCVASAGPSFDGDGRNREHDLLTGCSSP